MNLPDSFFSLKGPVEGEFKDKGSKFLAYGFIPQNEEEARDKIKQLRKEHHAAAHVCWAYILGPQSELEKSSDDREPSGSAGKPILRTLQEKKLTYTGMAVVRYFGGKLLGVPGLIHAYSEASRAALLPESLIEKQVFRRMFQACTFEQQHHIIRVLKQNSVKFFPDYQQNLPGITFELKPSQSKQVLEDLSLPGFDEAIMLETIYI